MCYIKHFRFVKTLYCLYVTCERGRSHRRCDCWWALVYQQWICEYRALVRWYLTGSNWCFCSKAWSIVSLSTRNTKWTTQGLNCSLWSETLLNHLSFVMTQVTLHFFHYIICYSVGCVMMCKYCVCVCRFLLCGFVHVCANIYVAICTITCKAHHMLWHCLFSTHYSEQQLLYHITCKRLL